MNSENLKTPSTDEARSRGQLGGLASGRARREKKLLRETLETILKMSLQQGDCSDIDDIQSLAETNRKNITVQDAIILAMVKKALKGDVKAAEYIRDTAGQKPTIQYQDESALDRLDEILSNMGNVMQG